MIEIIVEPKAIYVPLYYQPLYKVSQILMILDNCGGRNKSASISFLHTIAWAIRDEENLKILLDYKLGNRTTLVGWCYEPELEKALLIAYANEYCELLHNGKIKLRPKGQELVAIINNHILFEKQKKSLEQIGEIKHNSIDHNQNWDTQ